MFTIADIRNIAIQIEKNGEAAYLKASKNAADPHIAETLSWMATEEAHHAKWFENIHSSKSLTAEQKELEAMGRNLLQDMIKGNEFLLSEDDLGNAGSVEEVLQKSKEFEKETIIFYEFLLNFLDEKESVHQLKIIIEEERNHVKKLESLQRSMTIV